MTEGFIKIDNKGLYMINRSGVVISKKGAGNSIRIINPSMQSCGYKRIVIRECGQRKSMFHHRVVAEAFIPNPENKPCINHINGIKTDNRVENLEWCTYSENRRHSLDVLKSYNGQYDKSVVQISLDGFILNEYKSQIEAERQTGVPQSNIWACLVGKRKKAGGYIWL